MCVTVDVRFHNFDKIPAKKLRAVKVEQLIFLCENLKEVFLPQLPGRKYVTESSLGIVGREVGTFETSSMGHLQSVIKVYYLLTGCKGRTRKYKPKVFHTARACEGCLENQGLVFPGTARAPSW